MSQKVQEMYQKGIIDKYDRDTYMLFVADENGRIYLEGMLKAIVLEEPQFHPIPETYAWHDGRRSVWRNLALNIGITKDKLEEYLNDERSRYTDDPNRYPDNSL